MCWGNRGIDPWSLGALPTGAPPLGAQPPGPASVVTSRAPSAVQPVQQASSRWHHHTIDPTVKPGAIPPVRDTESWPPYRIPGLKYQVVGTPRALKLDGVSANGEQLYRQPPGKPPRDKIGRPKIWNNVQACWEARTEEEITLEAALAGKRSLGPWPSEGESPTRRPRGAQSQSPPPQQEVTVTAEVIEPTAGSLSMSSSPPLGDAGTASGMASAKAAE